MDSKDSENTKRGYLDYDFRLFHLKDRKSSEFEFHYHDFNKIILFISGDVSYIIEGKTYRLKPWDMLFVSSSEIHKPLISSGSTYERIVIWLKPAFLKQYENKECNLLKCFETSYTQKSNVLRLGPEAPKDIKYILLELEAASKSSEYGSIVLKEALFLQLMVHINRLYMNYPREQADIEFDRQIEAVLEYINDNLESNLTIDALASRFFMSKYYLMHKFKLQTGYSIHNYILQKRLIWANSLIREGKPILETSMVCGFGDYSNFVKAFKKMFGASPRNYYKNRS